MQFKVTNIRIISVNKELKEKFIYEQGRICK